jgi:hypothetical protein
MSVYSRMFIHAVEPASMCQEHTNAHQTKAPGAIQFQVPNMLQIKFYFNALMMNRCISHVLLVCLVTPTKIFSHLATKLLNKLTKKRLK